MSETGTSARSYLVLLRTPPVGYLMTASIVARLPLGMISLAIALMVSRGGTYGRAGLVIAAYVLGAAVSGPLLGRAVDRLGRARVLRPAALAEAVLLTVLAFLPVHLTGALAVCACAAGLSAPPIVSSTRSLWGDIVQESGQQAVFALEATLQELSFLIGPALVALLSAIADPRYALVASGLAVLAGVFAFTAHPAARTAPAKPGPVAEGARRRRPPISLDLVGVAVVLTGSFGVCELATVAFGRAHGEASMSGLVLAGWAAGSLLSGLVWGARAAGGRRPARRLALLVVAVGVGVGVPALAPGMPALGVLLFAGGITIAPAFAALYAFVSARTRQDQRTEAFGWLSGGFQVGAAAGAALGGALIQAAGPRAGYLAAGLATSVIGGGLLMGRAGREAASP